MDREYHHNQSLLTDIGILFKTVTVVIQRRGAY
jgi:lipopolysaccharide/colanic/teichoic acid biosynthesis glycosyltransferase